MLRPLRIGYIVPQFPGQTHIFFWREILALEALGHEVCVLSTREPPQGLIAHSWSAEAMARTEYLGGVNLGQAAAGLARLVSRGLPLWMVREGPGFAKDAILTMGAAQNLVDFSQKAGLDHVHAHSCGRSALIAAFARKMGGVPYSLTLHGPLSDYGPGQRFKWRDAAFATVITRALEAEVQERLAGDVPERLYVRPMGVDTDRLRRSAPYQPPEKGRPLQIFSCGRLNPVKGHQDLLGAIRQLLDQGVDVRLNIAGEDDSGGSGFRADLEGHLKKLHLQDHVKLLGAIDAAEVQEHLERAHLFVLASWHEPLGVAYMEAMSMGVPVIGTDSGGVPELIEDGRTGLLVPPQNPGILARTIRGLAGDPDALMRYSEAGRAHVDAYFRAALGAEVIAEAIAEGLARKAAE